MTYIDLMKNFPHFVDLIPTTLQERLKDGSLEVTDLKGRVGEFWGYKYSESEEYHSNSIVAIEFEDKLNSSTYCVAFFKGAQYRTSYINKVYLYPSISRAITDFEYDGFLHTSKLEDEALETLFEEHESDSRTELSTWAEVLMAREYFIYTLSIKKRDITQEKIEEIETLLKEAKEALKTKKKEEVNISCKKLFSRDTSVQELADIANDPSTPEIDLARYYFDTSLVHSFVADIIHNRLGAEKLTALKEEIRKEIR